MKVSLKIVLSIVFGIIAVFTFNIIKYSVSEYNTGIFAITLIIGCFAGVITIWSNNPKSLEV
jgi:uncharacterized membrane protein HdeD (DUF308 family)